MTKDIVDMKIKVSVVIPTRNRFRKLSALLDSLAAQSGNNGMDGGVEIIVVDDGSHRTVSKKIQNYIENQSLQHIRFHRMKNSQGPSTARNLGLALASGDIIVFLDDDCVPRKDFLRETCRVHKENPEVLVLNGKLVTYHSNTLASFWAYHYAAVFTRKGKTFYRVPGLSSGNFSNSSSRATKIGRVTSIDSSSVRNGGGSAAI